MVALLLYVYCTGVRSSDISPFGPPPGPHRSPLGWRCRAQEGADTAACGDLVESVVDVGQAAVSRDELTQVELARADQIEERWQVVCRVERPGDAALEGTCEVEELERTELHPVVLASDADDGARSAASRHGPHVANGA